MIIMAGHLTARCGCKYPDSVVIKVDMATRTAVIHCIFHGSYKTTLPICYVGESFSRSIPSKEWRKKERQQLGIYEH